MSRNPVLPIESILPAILESLASSPSLVIEAPPGAGKTTRVPPALLGLVSGDVIVLEPRRIAARLAARRVASELGESVGQQVGYQVRFEEAIGPRTRLRFVTEGVLTRRLLSDPTLQGVSAVVLDEFHERHLEGDLALAWLKRLQCIRADLLIVIMSATLDAAPIAQYLNACPILRSEGTRFPLTISHAGYSPKPLEVQVREALELLLHQQHSGDVLVFLPGAAEIRRTMRECEPLARSAGLPPAPSRPGLKPGLLLLPLHGGLPLKDQDLALAPAAQRKVIFATNVAESSVTVEGVSAVIDSGLARVASHSPWSGLPTLAVARISRAAALQRSGRAARTGPGRVIRLYSEEDFLRRPQQDLPEILRGDLSQLCLNLRGLALSAIGIAHFSELDWLDAPPDTALQRAEALLDRLGARGAMAQKLARYPLPPRLSRILEAAAARGVADDACAAVALLASGAQSSKNDLLAAMEQPPDHRTLQQMEQLRRISRASRSRTPSPVATAKHNAASTTAPGKSPNATPAAHSDDALLISVLAGFPDRVARRRAASTVLLSAGGSAEIQGEPPRYEYMVTVDAEDRSDRPLPLIRMTSRIEPEWLLDLFPERVREQVSLTWNREGERVEAVSALLYDDLVIQESRGAMPNAEAASQLLAQKALEAGVERFVDVDALADFMGRAAFAGLEPPSIPQLIAELCQGLRSFADLKSAALEAISLLEQKVGARRLNELAPSRLRLPSGRQTAVHYEPGKPPWIASRLQDFFGMKETPKIGPARTPVVVHLLAPNKRAVQTTTDLAGFWERLYPQVRRELMRRYPKHAWPEKP